MSKRRKSEKSLVAGEEIAIQIAEKERLAAKSVITPEEKAELVDALVIANASKSELADELVIANEERSELADELVNANIEKAHLASELIIANDEKAKRAAELVIANDEKAKRASELVIANSEKAKRAAELVIANAEKTKRAAVLVIANLEKEKRADELIIADKELAFQNEEKVKRAAELVIADVNKTKREAELVIANIEKAKWIAKSIIADKKITFQTEEKSKRAAELVIADAEKAKREAELVIANIKRAKRAAELVIANVEKAKRSAELVIANKELVYQKSEKTKREAEIIIANVEKAKRAAELVIANLEKAKRAAEFVILSRDLALAKEKEKLVFELIKVNKELNLQISERRLAEKELHDSYTFNRTLIKTIPFGMDIVDEKGIILFQNEKFKEIFGENAVGEKCWDLYREDKKQCTGCPLNKGINIGETNTYESSGVLNNRIFDINHTGMMYQGKKAMLEIFHDITERKKAEETLHESEKKYRELVENSPDAILIHQDRKIVFANKECLRLIGAESREDILIKSLIEFVHPDSRALVHERWKELQNTDTVLPVAEERFIRLDGKEIDVEVKGMSIIFEHKPAVQLIISNITERKHIESELIKAKERAEESDRLKSAFLTNMSHEIRTPMNGILGFTELLKEPNLSSDDQLDFIQTIQISGQRMLNTINNIVDISKIESGLTKVNINESNINAKTEFTYKFFKPEVETKGLQFLFKNGLPSDESIIKTDNEKVYAILTNLVKNAIKFTYNGSIEFGYEKKGEYLEFFVKDTGAGIPENQKELIFKRFRQGSESLDRAYEGSGLGLSICKSYVEMLGGKIWVESEKGAGSTFYFTIPYNPVSEENDNIEDVFSVEDQEGKMKNLKILIVEDDEISYSLLTRMVQKISYEVLHAITGIQAIEACRNNPDLDLVLMDIRMPQMDGNEATREIRKFNKDIIIIAQTAYAFSGDRKKAIEAGCNDYISKPVNKISLNEIVKKHIKNR